MAAEGSSMEASDVPPPPLPPKDWEGVASAKMVLRRRQQHHRYRPAMHPAGGRQGLCEKCYRMASQEEFGCRP